MTLKILAAASLALSLATGAALAQTQQGGSESGAQTPTASNPMGETKDFASDNERMLYEENSTILGGFFTDDTMASMRTDDEIASVYGDLSAEDQAKLKASCEGVATDRGSYGATTTQLCDKVGAM